MQYAGSTDYLTHFHINSYKSNLKSEFQSNFVSKKLKPIIGARTRAGNSAARPPSTAYACPPAGPCYLPVVWQRCRGLV